MQPETLALYKCSSCGEAVSPAAEAVSRGLERVSPTTQGVLEVTYHVGIKDLHLCAECLIAGYRLIVP
jgi:hypothetical protein